MNKKKNRVLTIIIIVIILLTSSTAYMLVDNTQIQTYHVDNKSSFETFVVEKIIEVVRSAFKNNKNVTVNLSQEDINILARNYMNSHMNKIKEKINLSDFEIRTEEQDIELIMKVKLVKILPTIIRVKFEPNVKDGKLILKVTSASIGKIKIPKSKFINILHNIKNNKMEIDEKEGTLIIDTKLPQKFPLNSITTNDNGISIEFLLNIHNINDILKILMK